MRPCRAGWLAPACALLLPGAAGAQSYANPSAVIAAEVAFAGLARDGGQWAAHGTTAAPGAVLFTPQPVAVADYVRKRPEPAGADSWEPHAVWSSCDGSFAVTTGSWHNNTRQGSFVALWQRQEKGGYQWLLRQTRETAAALPEPEMIAASVAECPKRKAEDNVPPPPSRDLARDPARGKLAPPPPVDPLNDASADGTLSWTASVDAQGTPSFTLRMRKDGAMQSIAP